VEVSAIFSLLCYLVGYAKKNNNNKKYRKKKKYITATYANACPISFNKKKKSNFGH